MFDDGDNNGDGDNYDDGDNDGGPHDVLGGVGRLYGGVIFFC